MTRTGLQMLRQSVPDVSAAKFNHTGAIGADPIVALLPSLKYLALFFPLIPFDMSIIENTRGHAMRAAIIALLLMIGSQAGAVQAIECKPGKKYLGIFVSAESPIPLPRFILDEERGWFYADEESSWRNWSNELTKTHGKGIYYLEIKKFGSKTYRKTAEMVFDRFSGEFTLTVYEEKRYLEYAWVKGANLYLLNGFCEKLARKF